MHEGEASSREHPPLIPLRKTWPAAVAAVSTLLLVGYLTYRPVAAWYEHDQQCRELEPVGDSEADRLRATESLRAYDFNDSGRDQWSPLAAGKYSILVSGDCSFSAECDFDVCESPESSNEPRCGTTACRGEGLSLMRLDSIQRDIIGFGVTNAPPRILVRILKNGQPFYEGSPSGYCPAEGFCVFAEVPTAAERAIAQDTR